MKRKGSGFSPCLCTIALGHEWFNKTKKSIGREEQDKNHSILPRG